MTTEPRMIQEYGEEKAGITSLNFHTGGGSNTPHKTSSIHPLTNLLKYIS
jgi:hypothetical protein